MTASDRSAEKPPLEKKSIFSAVIWPVGIEADFVADQVRMPLAGGAEILLVAEDAAGRAAGLGGRQGREQGRQGGLRFLAAEAAAHPPAGADDLARAAASDSERRPPESPSGSASTNGSSSPRLRPGWQSRPASPGRNAPARRCAIRPQSRCSACGERRRRVAASDAPRRADELLAFDRLLDGQHRRQRFDLDLAPGPSPPRRLRATFAGDRHDRLAADTGRISDASSSSSWKIGPTRFSGTSAAVKTATTPGTLRAAATSTDMIRP